MGDVTETERRLVEQALRTYSAPGERAAMRCALADACAMIDTYAKEVADAQRHHRYIKKRGQEDAALLTRAANIVWAMRDKITVASP